jgi:SnoaL-like polyketide cyclase
MEQTLWEWGRRVWVERDDAAIDALTEPAISAHGLGNQTLVGPEGFRSFHRALCAQLRETALMVDHQIEAGDWVAALCTFTGTTHDGRKIAITGSIHARIVGGRILEAYNHFDFLGLFAQLGLLLPDVLGRCLSGRPGCP